MDDERKTGPAGPRHPDAEGKRKAASGHDDGVGDVEFDLIDEAEDTLNDVFARDTAIPASPPKQLAAEMLRRADRDRAAPPQSGKPQLPPPPPMRVRRLTPVTLEPPPSEDLEFDNFDAPIDVFGHHLPGTQSTPVARRYGQSQMPTAPPGAHKGLLEQSRRTDLHPSRPNRPAFLAETTRNRPLDPGLIAAADEDAAGSRTQSAGRGNHDSALEFVDGLDPLLDSRAPMAGLGAPALPPSSKPAAGPKELQECYALGDYTRALRIAEDILVRSPDDISARRYAQNCRDVLTQMFAARIGPLDQVICVVVTPEEVQWLSLDHRAGFLLSLVDGQSTVDEILDISGMTRLDALKIIHDLTEQHVVRLT